MAFPWKWLASPSLFLLAPFAWGCSDPVQHAPLAEERLPGGTATNTFLFGSNAFKRPVEGISDEHETAFFSGNSFFNSAWVEAPSSTEARDGLGPLFNARSCSGCHFADGRGRPPLEPGEPLGSMLLRIGTGRLSADGSPEGDPAYGDQLQPLSLPGLAGEATPHIIYAEAFKTYPDGTAYSLLTPSYQLEAPQYGALSSALRISPRVAPAMIGLGLLEAIPDARLLALADPEDANQDGISGRPNRVLDVEAQEYRLGRFGWKAEQPTVRQQTAGAFAGDMGLTTSVFPSATCADGQVDCLQAPSGGAPEVSDDILDDVVLYSRFLAVPARQRTDAPEVVRGWHLFRLAGCDGCHTPNHQTRADVEPELASQSIWPYTDLLLHDMGEDLSDERPSFEATGGEWRTPPLWGVGRIPEVNDHSRLLHDGRARNVEEAILWHGGEAAQSRDEFRGLSGRDRAQLIEFVNSL